MPPSLGSVLKEIQKFVDIVRWQYMSVRMVWEMRFFFSMLKYASSQDEISITFKMMKYNTHRRKGKKHINVQYNESLESEHLFTYHLKK